MSLAHVSVVWWRAHHIKLLFSLKKAKFPSRFLSGTLRMSALRKRTCSNATSQQTISHATVICNSAYKLRVKTRRHLVLYNCYN